MSADHIQHDPVLDGIVNLRPRDVSADRADRLRRRCHAILQHQRQQDSTDLVPARVSWRRVVAPAFVSAWCVLYLFEILHHAAVIYGY